MAERKSVLLCLLRLTSMCTSMRGHVELSPNEEPSTLASFAVGHLRARREDDFSSISNCLSYELWLHEIFDRRLLISTALIRKDVKKWKEKKQKKKSNISWRSREEHIEIKTFFPLFQKQNQEKFNEKKRNEKRTSIKAIRHATNKRSTNGFQSCRKRRDGDLETTSGQSRTFGRIWNAILSSTVVR